MKSVKWSSDLQNIIKRLKRMELDKMNITISELKLPKNEIQSIRNILLKDSEKKKEGFPW
ncbi:hypothetical protein VQL36_00545 [Chengkuizengella sp. SCS-71B]|uniref:hypothetical protein n=1 Tax=Chengkuizengella sp. SCS-71B TaxID=3115290 RepID=UPI0032C23379